MTDMLVKLYGLDMPDQSELLAGEGVKINRAMGFDRQKICKFVGDKFSEICLEWVDECALTLMQQPPTCFIAVHEKQVVGFCCWDASAKGMLGPIGVDPAFRKKGIARELMRQTFEAMKSDGYAYAVIGWVSSEKFYEDVCGAISIPNSHPGVYSRLVGMD